MYELFWMAVGSLITGVIVHLYKNEKFKAAINEERRAAKEYINTKL